MCPSFEGSSPFFRTNLTPSQQRGYAATVRPRTSYVPPPRYGGRYVDARSSTSSRVHPHPRGVSAHSAPPIIRSDAMADPTRNGNIVMKGGITSGIVFPRALVEIARVFRFRSVGGTWNLEQLPYSL